MKLSIAFAAALAASANAAVLQRRQNYPDVSQCGLDAFEGHTAEALIFCSNILKSGTATETVTKGETTTVTTTRKTTTTVYPTSSRRSTPTPTPTLKPSSTPQLTPTPTPTPKPTLTPTPTPSTSSAPLPPSTLITSAIPTPSPTPACGIVAYVKSTPAYYFESSGTKNTFTLCQALCNADDKCLSFGYGEGNCMLFDVDAASNTNYNPTSPYTFYDSTCPAELPVRKAKNKRQLEINLPGGIGIGIGISLGLSGPRQISSACSCFITKGPAGTTVTRTATRGVTETRTVVVVGVVTRTAGGDGK